MASASGIRAGAAYVELGTDNTALERGLRRAESRLRAFGAGVQAVGQSFVKFGSIAASPFAASGKLFSDFESQMARVKAITNASGEEFAAMGGLAKKLGRDTVFSAAQAAEAMGNFAQAGLRVDEIMTATGPTLDLAAAAHIEIAEAASIATKVMKGMGLAADDLAAVVDIMAKAVTTSNTDITMLGDAFRFVGPVAKTAGIGFLEITAAIQVLSDAGIQGEMAGTTLRGMILSLAAPSTEAAQALAGLGVVTRDARGNFLPLVALIGQLERALAGMGSGDRLEKLGTIFPDRQAAGAAELVARGAEHLAKATAALGDSTGTAARISAVQLDTLRGAAEQLMSSLEGIAIAIGEALNPVLRRWGGQLVEVANVIAKVLENNKELVVVAGKATLAVIGIGAALIGVGLAAKLVAFQVGVLRIALAAVTGTIALVNGAFRLLTISIGVAGSASALFASLSSVLAAIATPVGIITVGLVGLAAAIYLTGNAGKVLTWLGDRFKDLAADAKFAFGGIADALKSGDIALAGQILWAAIKLEWVKGTVAVNTIWSEWGLSIREGFAKVSYDAASLWITGWHMIGAAFTSGVADITDTLAAAWSAIKSGWSGVWNYVANVFDQWSADQSKKWIGMIQELQTKLAVAKGFFTLSSSSGEIKKINEEADSARSIIDTDHKARADARAKGSADEQSTAAAAAAARVKARRDALVAAEKTRRDEQAALKSQYDIDVAARRKAADDAVGASKKELEAAQGALDGLVNQAKGRDSDAAVAAPRAPGAPGQDLSPEGLDRAIEETRSKVSVSGSFSAAAVGGLGAGDTVADKQLDEAKKTNDHLTKLTKKVDQKQAAFA